MKAVDDNHEFTGEILAQSKKAILFRGEYWEEGTEVWLARSQCQIDIDPTDPSQCTVLVPDWMAKKNGFADRD
jgi:hypothetical protein